jgi:hypothetical protein
MNIYDMAMHFGRLGLFVVFSLLGLCLLTAWTVIKSPRGGEARVIVYARVQILLCALVVPYGVCGWLWTLDGQTMDAWIYSTLYLHQYCLIQGVGIVACVAAVLHRYSTTWQLSAGDVLGLGSAVLIVITSIAAGHATAMMTRLGP